MLTSRESICGVSLDLIGEMAESILKASPVPYVRNAKVRGKLFNPEYSSSGLVSFMDTAFYVDHSEPLEALERVRESKDWHLDELLDGLEFLLLFEAKPEMRPWFMEQNLYPVVSSAES
jgi:hypothetical protein